MNSSMLVINIISSYSGGGAEFLVRSVDRHIQSSFYDNETLYFNKDSLDKVNFCKSEQELSISSRNFLAIFKIRKYLISKLKTHDCIVLHAHLTWPLFYVAIASLGLNLHLIYTEHSTFNKRRNYPYLKFIDRWAYSRYEKIIGISKATSTSLLNWLGTRYQNKIITIENGAELSQFTPRENLPTDRKLKLLSVGSLKHLKGFETTIRSLQAVKDIVSSYTIVGSGPDLDRLQNLAKECGVDDIIHFAGWSDNPESFYQDADVLLIPSHWEGFGLVAVEGLSTGLPVIASNVSGLNEVVSEELLSSILIDNFKEPDEWCAAINVMKELLEGSAKELSLASRAQSENFNIEKMLNAYEELYIELSQK